MVRRLLTEWRLGSPRPLLPKFKRGKEKVFAFIQARTNSTRLPNKIYKELNGAPILFHTIARAKEASKLIDDVIVLSPEPLPELPDDTREFILANHDENDVLTRFVECWKANPCDYIVRLTSDCPLLDPRLIEYVVGVSILNSSDYGSNVLEPSFPDGVDVEIFSASTLHWLDNFAKDKRLREHVTLAIREEMPEAMNLLSVVNDQDYSKTKISIDTESDLERVRQLEALHD